MNTIQVNVLLCTRCSELRDEIVVGRAEKDAKFFNEILFSQPNGE